MGFESKWFPTSAWAPSTFQGGIKKARPTMFHMMPSCDVRRLPRYPLTGSAVKPLLTRSSESRNEPGCSTWGPNPAFQTSRFFFLGFLMLGCSNRNLCCMCYPLDESVYVYQTHPQRHLLAHPQPQLICSKQIPKKGSLELNLLSSPRLRSLTCHCRVISSLTSGPYCSAPLTLC